MAYVLYDYKNEQGDNEIKTWTKTLQPSSRAKLNQKLDHLELHGDALMPLILTGTPTAGILKLRIRGNVQYRPMLCKGPVDVHTEYTLLMGAKEVSSEYVPANAHGIADERKTAVIASPATRRIKHERVA